MSGMGRPSDLFVICGAEVLVTILHLYLPSNLYYASISMPPDDITDLVTHGGRQEKGLPEGIYVRFTSTTRDTETLI